MQVSFQYDPLQCYQKIDHFSASAAWTFDVVGKQWSRESREKIADLLFSVEKGIGLSAFRFSIGAGSDKTDRDIITDQDHWRRAEVFKESRDGAYDWNKHKGQQWFLQAAKQRGVDRMSAILYSPPVWMTKNGHAQPDEFCGTSNLKSGWEKEFCVFIADVLDHFRKEKGVVFNGVSPVNEPSWDWNRRNQEGNRYNNDDIKRLIKTLAEEMKRRNLDTRIETPEASQIGYLLDDAFYYQATGGKETICDPHQCELRYGGKYREFIKEFIGDPAYKARIGNRICGHSYFTDRNDQIVPFRKALRQNLLQYDPDTEYWQTEYCILGPEGFGRDLGMEPALWAAKVIHYDLTVACASAWSWWLALSPHDYKDGLLYTDYNQPGDEETLYSSKILWALGHYSKFIRPGFVRSELSGPAADSNVLGSVYQDPESGKTVFVFINQDKMAHPISVKDGGTKRDIKLDVFMTTGEPNVNLQKTATLTNVDNVLLPARSLTTLIGNYAVRH